MAGKKQHFIPQHFLKPFVVPGGGDHLWMYRKGQSSAIRVARSDAAAQNYFYSRPSGAGSPTLDDVMTRYENQLHKTVDEVRSLEIGQVIDSGKVAKIVGHLVVRSSHLRGAVAEALDSISTSFQNLICSKPDALPVDLSPLGPSEQVHRMISDELAKSGSTEITQHQP